MINGLPLYPKKRTLKNVIADYYKSNLDANSILLLDGFSIEDYGKKIFEQMGTAFDYRSLEVLYTLLVGYYKYSVIGYDSDDEFIDRFTNRWLAAVPVQGRALINAWQSSLRRSEIFTRTARGSNSEERTDTSKGTANSTASGTSNALERTVPTLVNESESNGRTETETAKSGNSNGEHTESVTEDREYNDIVVLNEVAQTQLMQSFLEQFENLFMGVFE